MRRLAATRLPGTARSLPPDRDRSPRRSAGVVRAARRLPRAAAGTSDVAAEWQLHPGWSCSSGRCASAEIEGGAVTNADNVVVVEFSDAENAREALRVIDQRREEGLLD